MENKRGLSEIVTTLIMILLGIVIVGVVWAVVSGLVNNAKTQAELSSKCQDSAISITYAACNTTTCTVTVKRDQGIDLIEGLVVSIQGGEGKTNVDTSGENLPIGTTYTAEITNNVGAVTRAEAKMYLDNKGKDFYCTNLATTDSIMSV